MEYYKPGKVGRDKVVHFTNNLVNIYIEELVREALEDLEEGIKVVLRKRNQSTTICR